MYARLVGLCVLLITSPAYASTYAWNPALRPPVSLREALTLAHEALAARGEVQFCASASLSGSKSGGGESGTWNLFFVMTDGRYMQVCVTMQKAVDAMEWAGYEMTARPRPQPARPPSLEHLAQRLRDLLRDASFDATVTFEDDVLTVTRNVRPYAVYSCDPTGEMSNRLIEEVGPRRDGLWLRVMRTDRQADWVSKYDWAQSSGETPYWYTRRDTYFLSDLTPIALELRTSWDTWTVYAFGGGFPPPSNDSVRENERTLVAAVLKCLDASDEWEGRYSHTKRWNWEEKPPISLEKALDMAEEATVDLKPQPYCLGRFGLWGDPRPDPSTRAWHIDYVQDAINSLHIAVHMDGKVEVQYMGRRGFYGIDPWPQITKKTIDTGATSLEGAKERLEQLFAGVAPPATIRLADNSLTLAFRTRQFEHYPYAGREFAEQLVVTEGPLDDGIWVHVRLAPKQNAVRNYWESDDAFHKHSSFWQPYRALLPTIDPNKQLDVDIRYGQRADALMWKALWSIGYQDPYFDND
ncbi:MAG: hypothetical protein ACYC3X_30395 [Pirellulaceae bacterium]